MNVVKWNTWKYNIPCITVCMEQVQPEKHSDNKLRYKNNSKGLDKFFRTISTYKNNPAPKMFMQCLSAVMQKDTEQKDTLKIVEAWDKWNNIWQQTLVKRKDLLSGDALLKVAMDKFMLYYVYENSMQH